MDTVVWIRWFGANGRLWLVLVLVLFTTEWVI